MEAFDLAGAGGPSPPRRELQLHGPRPAPLKVSKDSHKIRKPPLAQPPQHAAAAAPPPQLRQPVIIYTVSPKVIHIRPSEFMSIVQRLTGLSPSARTSVPGGPINPAAGLAGIEKAASSPAAAMSYSVGLTGLVDDVGITGSSCQAGILSPAPSSLRPVPPAFFSPLGDMTGGSLSFLNDLSPAVLHGGKGFMDNSSVFSVCPENLLSTPAIPSPRIVFITTVHHVGLRLFPNKSASLLSLLVVQFFRFSLSESSLF
ncbi:Protein MKS1 [Apostasia shenzhenica]|uniref:Protein MKS1 n=1 Tax=Apostasia shenzhenica TaxID=1088818 RepID=A0A2I0BG88_9ASPA|nr:Protein MKS1 [Apostasia shenzhenica]